jgi:predicted dehydrogenase/threonine dehydrogenase-like Zn-dependent dehydrogenase
MRQVFLDKGNITVKEVAEPSLDDHLVLVAVRYSLISSGTELATINQAKTGIFNNVPHKIKKVLESIKLNGLQATTSLIKEKIRGDVQSLGYSCSGQVIAVGKKVKNIRAGDLVACAGAGYANHADLVCVPESLVVPVRNEQFLRAASLTTLGAIALQGVRQADVVIGEYVAVIGLGLLGQLTVQLAKKSGAFVIGIDLLPDRVALARQHGADVAFQVSEHDIIAEIAFLTNHYGVDVTIITAASTSNEIIQQAMQITRKKGRVVVVGDIGLTVSRDPFYQKEIDLRISCSYGPGRYDPSYEEFSNDYPYAYVRWTENRNMQAFVSLLERQEIVIDNLISKEATLETVEYVYKQLQEKEVIGILLNYRKEYVSHGAVKTTLTPQEAQDYTSHDPSVKNQLKFIPAKKDSVRVGFVGVGGFAKIKLLPIVSKLKNTSIDAIVDADISNSMSVSRTYGAAKAYACDNELFQQDIVDAVVIASPHKFHCDQALMALKKGKAVFLEKPMVTSFEQLERLRQFFREYPEAPFCVDYNRSFSPFMQKIKAAVDHRHAPMMVHYRMNAGYVPKEHWIQTAIGAGRIIGEACHIIELFCFLVGSKPRTVSVEAIHASRDDIFPTDNLTVQIRFAEGSICSLLYTALGHKTLSKERMEVHFDGKTIIMDDYMKLEGYGMPSSFAESTPFPNKGHETLLNQFFTSFRKGYNATPIAWDHLDMVAELTLIIDQLACRGGGEHEFQV